MNIPEINGTLRAFRLNVPEEINACSGLRLFGRLIKSVLYSTDACIIPNCNADAVIAVYPFTPHPPITEAVMKVASVPVFVGVGGGLTKGPRVIGLARHAEFQNACGVVVNAPTSNEVVAELKKTVDIPVVVTVLSEHEDIEARFKAGADILNVSAAAKTVDTVRSIRQRYPDAAIIATGGPTAESIVATVEAGANCITWTPPSNGEVFKGIMDAYRKGLPHP
ncbi:MAG: hydrolase [Oscillospiraceae bacterium]|nr:hydrolase [Oscillospiraceae bacterium]